MNKRLLVPLDGSPLAEVALPYTEELAVRLGADIILLSVLSVPDPAKQNIMDGYLKKVAENTRQRVKDYKDNPNIAVKPVLLTGHEAEIIVDYAEKENVNLIIMATHGYSGIKRWSLGNIANKVVRVTNKPIALIRAKGARPDVKEKTIVNKILVPLDGSKEGEVSFHCVEELAVNLKTEVVLLQVVAKEYWMAAPDGGAFRYCPQEELETDKKLAREYLEKVADRLKQKGIPVRVEIKLGDAPEEIIKYEEESDSDVVVMATHGRSAFARWTFGSVAARVLHEGTIPLILVRAPAGTR